MEIKFILNTEKYKSLKYTDNLSYIQDQYADRFPTIDTLRVEIREHPRLDLQNYKQATHHPGSKNRACTLKISIYAESDPMEFKEAITLSLEQLISTLSAAQ